MIVFLFPVSDFSDNISFVSVSVIQHTGQNILSLLQNLINREGLKTTLDEHNEQAVFYDILGQFMVCYSMTTAFRINMSVVVLSLLVSTFLNIKIFRSAYKLLIFFFLQRIIKNYDLTIYNIFIFFRTSSEKFAVSLCNKSGVFWFGNTLSNRCNICLG